VSNYHSLVDRLQQDPELRAALAAATTPEARAELVRAAGLELPDADEILQGVAGGTGICELRCTNGNGALGNGGNGSVGFSTPE
jgi:hypothetical protein